MRHPALPLVTLLLAGPALAQAPTLHTLLQRGDAFLNGMTVSSILDMDVANDGTWIALCQNSSHERFVVKDGVLGPYEGMTLMGETVADIHAIAVDQSGQPAMLYSVEPAVSGGLPEDRIFVDDAIVLARGDDVTLGTIGLTGTVEVVYGFDLEGTEMIISCLVDQPSGPNQHALLIGSNAPGTFTPVGGFREGSAIGGATDPFFHALPDLDLLTSGQFAATVHTTSFAAGTFALVNTGVAIVETGAAGYSPNSTWTLSEAPVLARNNNGHAAVAGEVALSNGLVRGAIYVDGTIVMIESHLIGLGYGSVADFATTDVVLGDDDDVIYTLPLTSGEQVLMENASPLFRTGNTSTAEGFSIDRINGVNELGSSALAQSEDGSIVLMRANLNGVTPALLRFERNLSEPTSCSANPNSTGSIGHLEASGSRYVSVDDLTLTATDLPASQFGLLACSLTTGFTANPGGSAGNICLGGAIGRFNSLVAASDAGGAVGFDVQLGVLPQPMGTAAAQPGDTWYFQVWHREPAGSGASSNFTEAVAVEML